MDVPVEIYAPYGTKPAELKESFLENGLSHYMSKPFDKNTLLNLLEKILSNSLDKLKTNSQT